MEAFDSSILFAVKNDHGPKYVPDYPKVIISLVICILGLFGNLVAIFVILVLKEYQKSVTHWYVLQLAIADSLFLLTLPFKVSEDLNNQWIYAEWLCKAKETILFLNYYASIMFLVIMSIDRYIAVCHTFSDWLQKLRKRNIAYIITICTWAIALLTCIPVMLYSFKIGAHPTCKCSYEFPKAQSLESRCIDAGFHNPQGLKTCLKNFETEEDEYCTRFETTSDFFGKFLSGLNISNVNALIQPNNAIAFGGPNISEGGQNGFSLPSIPFISSVEGGQIQDSINPSDGGQTQGVVSGIPGLLPFPSSNASDGGQTQGVVSGIPWLLPFPSSNASGGGQTQDFNPYDFFGNNNDLNGKNITLPGSTFLANQSIGEDRLIPDCSYLQQPKGWEAFLIFNFVVMFLVPLLVMIACYGLIIHRLSETRMRTASTSSFTHQQSTMGGTGSTKRSRKSSTRSDKDRRRVTIMCASLVACFVICWLPFHAAHLAKLARIKARTEYVCNLLPKVGSLLGYLNSALNPYLYSFLGTNFSRRWRMLKKSKGIRNFVSIAAWKRGDSSGSLHHPVNSKMSRKANASMGRAPQYSTKAPMPHHLESQGLQPTPFENLLAEEENIRHQVDQSAQDEPHNENKAVQGTQQRL